MGGFSGQLGSNHGGFQSGWGDAGGGGFSPSSLGTQVQMWTLDGVGTRTVNSTIRLKDKSRSGTARQMQPGRSYLFAGVTDEIAAAGRITTGSITTLSCCAWVQITDTATVRTIAAESATTGNERAWQFRVNAAEQLEIVLSSDGTIEETITSTITLSTGSLVHVAFTWSGSSLIFYVDGVAEAGQATTASALNSTTEAFSVGAINTSGTAAQFFTGYIQDLRVFSDVLTAVEVADIAATTAGEAGIGANDPLVWYKCDEGGTVTVARDSSGNASNGTIAAATIGDFHDATNNDKYSFQNEVGYTDDTGGATAAYLPRDESATTLDVLAGALDFTGQAPRDPVLSSPCVTFDGVDDLITVGATGLSAIALDCRIKLLVDDQEIMSFQNTALTGVSVNASQTLEFGGSLTMSSVTIDGVSYTSDLAGAGALLNDNAWHRLIFVVSAISASNLVFGTDDSVAFGNIALADIDVTSSAPSTICDLKCSEGIGDICHDNSASSLNNDGILTGVESEIWAAQQNLTDTMVTNGVAVATRFSGTGEYYLKAARLTSGTLTTLSVAAWARFRAAAVSDLVTCEDTVAAGSRGWGMYRNATDKLIAYVSDDGSALTLTQTSTASLADDTWYHLAFVYASGAITLYVDGVAFASSASGAGAASIFDSTGKFTIGAFGNAANAITGLISGVVVEATEWSAATVLALSTGTVPSTAWYFRDGNGTEHNQSLAALPENGTPDRIPIPTGILPVNVGPQILQTGQSLDLGCGEASSPYAQQLLASALPDLTYAAGDDEENAIQFARVLATDDDGDDRIIVALPALTAGDLTDMQDYTDE